MKLIIHRRADYISIAHPSPSLLASMTGSGEGWSQERIDLEVGKWVNPPAPEVGKSEGVVRPFFNAVARGGVTEDEAIELIRARNDPDDCLGCRVIDESELPAESKDRGITDTFRDAWEDTGTAVQVNMTSARTIHMDRIRFSRNAELAEKDISFLRAVEAGDTSAQSTIGTEKQTLRDIPATFDITTGVTTPDQLKARWPTELPARE